MAVFTAVRAVGTLTATANLANTETVVIGGKTYTFQDTLTDADGNVKVGADLATSLANLAAAINLGAGAGTAYAASMTKHTMVKAVATATTVVVTAFAYGAVGNLIATTETSGTASWGAATMASGAGNGNADLNTFLASMESAMQMNAQIITALDAIRDELA